MLRNWIRTFSFVFLLVLSSFAVAHAQDNAAVTGIVTDASGAAVPDTAVVLTNPSRGIKFTAKTNGEGSYRFPNVPPAPGYQLSFEHSGFSSTSIKDVTLLVGITQTQNAKLSAGSSQTVEVTASNATVTLNTTDASIGNNFDIELVNDLPVQNRNSPAALFNLQPGVTNSGLTNGGSVTGARTDQTSVTVDGMDVNDISTGQFGNTNGSIPVDATQEFRGTVAGLPSNIGTGSGGQFQLVTKSGTNRFHGDLNEYHRDTSTASNPYFNKVSNLPRTPLIRNQFGGAIGGPILKDKLFFFADFYNSRIVSSLTGSDTVPLDSYRAGNISYVKSGCSNTTSRQNSTPSCIGMYTPAQIKALDPAGIGEDPTLVTLFNTRYPRVNDVTGGDGVNTGTYRFTQPTLNVEYDGVARLDYNLTQKQRVFVQFHEAHRDSVQSVNRFGGDPLTRPFQDRSYGFVGSHTWQIGNNKVNQFYFGDNVTVFSFGLSYNPNPANGASYISSLGSFTTPYDDGNIQRRRVPIPTIRDDYNWTLGHHNISTGGTFKFIKASNFLGSDYNTYTVGLGGNVSALNNTLRPADIATTTLAGAAQTTNTTQWDNAFAAYLGRVARIGSIYNFNASGQVQPQPTGANRRYRYFQTELYAGDTWKVNKNLTLTYGVRYQIDSVPYETLGAESIPNIGFDDYFRARLAQSAAHQTGASSLPLITYNLGGAANNAAPIYNPNYFDIAPRVAFAYTPGDTGKTVINGSFAVVYDRTVANAVNFLQNQNTFLFQNNTSASYGTSSDPAGSLATDPRVGGTAPAFVLPAPPTVAALTKPYTPYVNAAGLPTGLAGQNSNYAVDPHLKDPYNLTYNLGLQQELPGRFFLSMTYVGRLGRRLLGQADASQLIDYTDPTSSQALSSAFANLTTFTRANPNVDPRTVPVQPFFENVITPGYGATKSCGKVNNVAINCNSNTAFIYYNNNSLVSLGDITDTLQSLATTQSSTTGTGLPINVGLASQFSRNTYQTNKGFSNYNGLLVTVRHNLSQGVKFDLNYTMQHSIDNVSFIANASAGTTGFICDVTRPRACRGNSDFDVTHVVTSDFLFQLPYGRGRAFGSNAPLVLRELLGDWNLSGTPIWQSGIAFTTSTGAFLAGFANNDPAIYDGSRSDDTKTHVHKNAAGQLVAFDAAKALTHFRGPIGIEYGSRNNLRAPSQFFFDAGLSKTFQLLPEDRLRAVFRADAFNVLNHPTFGLPTGSGTPTTASITSATFGVISSSTASAGSQTYRAGQFSLRLEF